MIKEMNKKIFRENLVSAVEELKKVKKLEFEEQKFIINPVEERNKKLNSMDDFMRMTVLTEENIGGKLLRIDDVIGVLGGLIPLLPIWINISFVEMIGNKEYDKEIQMQRFFSEWLKNLVTS